MTLTDLFFQMKHGYILDNKTDANGAEHGTNGQFVSKGGNSGESKEEPKKKKDTSTEKKDQRGVKITQVSNIMNINDCEFLKPTKSYLLPPIDKKFAKAIKKENKKLLLSKQTIGRMAKDHPEMGDGTNRRNILNNALNNFTDIIYSRPHIRPNYYALVKNGKYYDMAVIDTDKNKEYFEVVDWRKINESGYTKMIEKMEREDGQFLITDGRTSTGRLTFPLFRSNNSTIPHDSSEINSLEDLFRMLKTQNR